MPFRKPVRLKNYDYSQAGAYFITICIQNRIKLLWSYSNSTNTNLPLSDIGKQIECALQSIGTIYSNVFIDEYTIMPNHIHFILIINQSADNRRPMVAPTVSRVIQQLKGYVTKNTTHENFHWQKSYYEHIIRDEQELREIREYIWNNPLNWQDDMYFS